LLAYIELWDNNFQKTSGGRCKGTDGDNFENNASVVLVGPDDSELSATSFAKGRLVESQVDKSLVTNFPQGEICRFDIIFPFPANFPEVATYRLKLRDGAIQAVSFPLSDILRDGEIGLVYGADFKD
jgi:hypothetical protein